ncbi:MAG: hypothetical protein EBS18_06015, partial [Actinobacteria bacterium]|nr:hypothetical protein [Actinomycetota bacterium]
MTTTLEIGQAAPDFELTNLPFSIEKVTIVYDAEASPSKFYEQYKRKIKLPFNCSLKIIKSYYNQYYSYYGDDDNYNNGDDDGDDGD